MPIGNTSCAGGGFPTVWTDTSIERRRKLRRLQLRQLVFVFGVSVLGLGHADDGSNWTTWCSGGICSWVSPIYCLQQ